MKRAITIATASVAAALLTLTVGVSAQFETHDRTFLTFSAPVEMPGVTLPAGTYVFKIADTPGRNVVQVFDKDEKDIIGQWLYVPADRPQVTGETVVTFKETREGMTPAVQFWYYPGERTGKEFIYPRQQALQIAARTGAEVRTDEGVVNGAGLPAEQPAEATVAVAAPTPAPAAADVAPPMPEAVGTSGVQQESTTAYNQSELPRTSSPLALSGLLGLLALAGAAGLRRYRQQ